MINDLVKTISADLFGFVAIIISVVSLAISLFYKNYENTQRIRREDWLPIADKLSAFRLKAEDANVEFNSDLFSDIDDLVKLASQAGMNSLLIQLDALKIRIREFESLTSQPGFNDEYGASAVHRHSFDRLIQRIFSALDAVEDELSHIEKMVRPKYKQKLYWHIDGRFPFLYRNGNKKR